MKKKILFLIHDLGPGGAEKVLVNLANGLDKRKFDISLRTLFDWGPNRKLLSPEVHYSSWIKRDIPGNSHWMKLWSPENLFKHIIPEKFDIIVSFLEGPSARVVGGCPENGTKVISWIHITQTTDKEFCEGFRSHEEAEKCYHRADSVVFVSEDVKKAFIQHINLNKNTAVIYNVYESEKILNLSSIEPSDPSIDENDLNWCSIGKLIPRKGWDRLLKLQKRLISDGINAKFFVLGDGPLRSELTKLTGELGISDTVIFTGYQMNPYAYLSRCKLAVCASQSEGFSTAAVESLIVGTPFCSIEVGGMKEILGNNDEFGVVTKDNDETLYHAVRKFLIDPEYQKKYQQRAYMRGKDFDKTKSINTAENLFLTI